jgi:citrate lyase subunit beta / citryl-CoA lyase
MIGAARSLLFAPGDRADLLAKLGRAQPDAVVIDWEDAVAPTAKANAREVTAAAVAAGIGDMWVAVRVNPVGSPWFADDVAALPPTVDGVVVPKLDTVHDAEIVRERVGHHEVVVGIETVLGVLDARTVLATGARAAYFGAEDYIADLGGVRSESNAEVLYARSHVAAAARVADVAAFDQIVAAYRDLDRFERECVEARNLGYAGKLCIHPGQVEIANRVFTPDDDEVARATAIVEAATSGGVVAHDGLMIDGPLVRQANAVLARARRS